MFGTYNRLGVHVSASNVDVIRAASRKLQRRDRYTRKHREARHAFYRVMLHQHEQARELYSFVMGGCHARS